ncbi:MAG TPA: hypothetical protein VGJ92_12580 [Methanocella sp.]
MMKIVGGLVLIALALALVSGMATAQQAYTGTTATVPAQSTMQAFTLGGDTRYTIGPISTIDAWRSAEMGINWVSLPAGTTVHVMYMTGMPSSTSVGTPAASMIVFGPPGYVGSGSWSGATGSAQSYSFTGTVGQNFMVTQQAGGTGDRVVVSFT